MGKNVILTESQLVGLIGDMAQSMAPSKQYTIDPEKVLMVKAFLDKNYMKGIKNIIGADGVPTTTQVIYLAFNGQPVEDGEIDQESLKDTLIEKYKDMFVDEDEREKFLGQVMKDWYNNKIGLYGSLSVNHL